MSGRQGLELSARLQVLDLCHLVDPAGDHPFDRRPGPHDPHPRAHDRGRSNKIVRTSRPMLRDRPRADPGGSWPKLAMPLEEGAQGPQDRQGADPARNSNRRRGGFASRRPSGQNAILPIDATIQSNLRETTTRVLASLTPREERVLRMRFGIGANTDHTLEEVGPAVLGDARTHPRQIEAKALQAQASGRSRKLRSFLDN